MSPVWNPKAIDYDEGVDLMPDGTIRGRVIGCYVDTLEEVKAKAWWNNDDDL